MTHDLVSEDDDGQTFHRIDINSAQLMLQELRRTALIRAEDWAATPALARAELEQCEVVSNLLALLTAHGLLTAYQSQRIAHGEMRGLMLGNYRILDWLGSGGMGDVYRGEHRLMLRPVAVKVVSIHGVADRESESRFFMELRAISQLQHPNIVAALDAGEKASDDRFQPTLLYYVMELVPGQSLEDLVKSHGPLPPERACEYICQIASALEKAHQHDLIHRDIKPSNIMITPEGQAKLLDFGLVRDLNHRVTQPGVPLGTLAYMAPEQARDASLVDHRVDVYGLGSTLYWCLTGKPPFASQHSLARDLLARLTEQAPNVRGVRPELPAELENVVSRMMAFRLEDRYPSVLMARQALLPFQCPRTMLAAGLAAAPHAAGATPIAGQPHSHRILVVDDEPELRQVCKLLIGSDTITCDEAPDGKAALAAMAQQHYDLVLMDCEMPNMDGIEVARELRRQPPSSNLKVILMSGRIPPDDMAHLMKEGVDDFLSKPFSSVQLLARVRAALRLKDAQDRNGQLVSDLLHFNGELERSVNARDIDLIHARNAIVLALAKLSEYRDNETGTHLMRLERYCRCLAAEAARQSIYAEQITDDFVEMLACCAPLHDIGKVGVPDHILHKPGKLDPDERLLMQSHTIIGAETLQAVAREHGFALPMLNLAAAVARYHHERWDGTGYPDRLAGADIPLAARMVAIADVYDALRSRRVYKPALSHDQTVQIVIQGFGTQFDPALLPTFRRCMPQFENIYADCYEK